MHIPPNDVSEVMIQGISLCRFEVTSICCDVKVPRPLVISRIEPSIEADKGDRFNVCNNNWIIIVKSIIYPPILTCISKAERMQLSISVLKDCLRRTQECCWVRGTVISFFLGRRAHTVAPKTEDIRSMPNISHI